MKSHFGLIAEHVVIGKGFRCGRRARGRVMTDLLDVRRQNLARVAGYGKNIARLRLQLSKAHSDKDIEKLRTRSFWPSSSDRSLLKSAS